LLVSFPFLFYADYLLGDELQGAIRLKDVEDAQQEICSIIMNLGRAGEIIIQGSPEDELAAGDTVLSDAEKIRILAIKVKSYFDKYMRKII